MGREDAGRAFDGGIGNGAKGLARWRLFRNWGFLRAPLVTELRHGSSESI